MELEVLKVSTREALGKGPARQARLQGQIPAVLYARTGDAVHLMLDGRTFSHMVRNHRGKHPMLQIEVEGNPGASGPALVKEVQADPVRGHPLHADFLKVDLEDYITTIVPVELAGLAPGLTQGGVMDQPLREVKVRCKAKDLPEIIPVDVTDMELYSRKYVEDVTPPTGVTILTPGRLLMASVQAGRAARAAAARAPGAKAEEKKKGK